MSDDEGNDAPSSGTKRKGRTKRVLRRSNTSPAKAKPGKQTGITLPQMENNFASQLHTLDDDVDPARTAQQEQMERKLAKLRSRRRVNQRQSAPTTPRKGSQDPPQREPASFRAPVQASKSAEMKIDGFDDPFFTNDPFANDAFSFSSPDLIQDAPPVVKSSRQSYTQPLSHPAPSQPPPIAQEHTAPQTVALAPPATSVPVKRPVATTRAKRSNTLPTLPMSSSPVAASPIATEERNSGGIEFDTLNDPFDMLKAQEKAGRPPLKNDDSSDLTMFYSYSAPASRRASQTAADVPRPYVPYVHPVNANASGQRTSLVYVPVQVPVQMPMYNVAGGVPYAQPQPRQPASQAGYSYPSASMSAPNQQWVQPVAVPQRQYQQPQYPMTPPAHAQRGW